MFGFLLLLLLGWIALRLRLALLGRAGLRVSRPVGRPLLLGFLVMFLFGLSFVCYRFVRRGRLVSCWLQNRLRPLFTLFSFWEKTFFLFLHLLLLGVLVRFGLFNFGFPVKVNVNTKVNKLFQLLALWTVIMYYGVKLLFGNGPIMRDVDFSILDLFFPDL